MDIYIDTRTGVWGDTADIRIVKDYDRADGDVGDVGYMPDPQIIEFGLQNGKPLESKTSLLGRLDQAFHNRRVIVADEEPANETQIVMTEGLLIGLDVGQALAREVIDGEGRG